MKKQLIFALTTVAVLISAVTGIIFVNLSPVKDTNTEKINANLTASQQSENQSLPSIFQNNVSKFEGIDIPVYVPAYLPGDSPYGISNFRSSKNSFGFEVIKAKKNNIAISMADSIVVISASDQPFSTNPIEEQLIAKPAGIVQIDSITANSYEKGMAVTWSQGNWGFIAVGHAEQDGIRVAKEIIQALPDVGKIVPRAVKGKLRVSQLGNPMYVTASWTYDGNTWYTLDGRSSVAENIKMLQSVTRLTEQTRSRARYYPLKPCHKLSITTPEIALQAYFDTLFFANNLTPEQIAAAGGTLAMGQDPYLTAYSYWSKEWQDQNSYKQFLASWAGTVNVELLKLLPAGEEKSEKRFFVETKHIEIVGEKPRPGIFYYTGFFTVRRTTEGWRITTGQLEPENLAWKLGGHQPWRADAEQVARVSGLGASIDEPLGTATTIENEDGTLTVIFVDEQGKESHKVTLVEPENGIWQVLDKK